MIWADVVLEAKVAGVKDNVVVEEARTINNELVKRQPPVQQQGGGR